MPEVQPTRQETQALIQANFPFRNVHEDALQVVLRFVDLPETLREGCAFTFSLYLPIELDGSSRRGLKSEW